MKVRESGMPDQEMWENFFDPRTVLATLGLNNEIHDVAEFGCGYGTFTIPAAEIIKGEIHALDIEPEMIRSTMAEAEKRRLGNVRAIQRDFLLEGSGLVDSSVDYVMLFNILHLDQPMILVNEARRILKKGGKLGIIHWNYDPATPRGPSMAIRPRPEDCIKWAKEAGFINLNRFDLKPYHYGITMSKQEVGL